MNLTAPGIGSAFLLRPTYINLLLLLCVRYVYFYTCLHQYQSRGLVLDIQVHSVSCDSLYVEGNNSKVSFCVEKDCQRALFHLTHFIFHTNNFSVLKLACWKLQSCMDVVGLAVYLLHDFNGY